METSFSELLGQTGGVSLIVFLWLVASGLILLWTRKQSNSANSFLVSNRNIGPIMGTLSVAVAWIWAPALFVASQKAYQQGIAGLFWFTLPNAMALIIFSFLAVRMKKIFNEGYTLPEYIGIKFGKRMRITYLLSIFIIQIYSVIVQLTGALLILKLTTGLPKEMLIIILGSVILAISILRGLKSSLVTDMLKSTMLGAIIFLIIPIIFFKIDGWMAINNGLGGISGNFTNILDPKIVWTFGVPISISLISGIVVDQQQWQRAFAIKTEVVRKTFVWGGIIFVLVPVMLGSLGLIAASQDLKIVVSQPQLAGVAVIQTFLPSAGMIAFVIMILAALIASGSAALSAAGSIGSVDLYRILKQKHFDTLGEGSRNRTTIKASRLTMITILIIATCVALVPNIEILYMQLLVGAFRAALIIPTILALFWNKLSEKSMFWGIITSISIGVPLFVYGSIQKMPAISSFGSLAPIVITAVFCYLGREKIRQALEVK